MKTKRVWYGVAILLSVSIGLYAQSLDQAIIVNLPEEVTVRDKTLQPGEYEIRKESNTVNPVLRFFSNDKLQYETAALPIPVESKEGIENSKVVVEKVGDESYLTKVWIRGASTGYELPLPERARALQKELAQLVASTTKAESVSSDSTSPVVSAPPVASESNAAERAEREEPRIEIAQNTPSEPVQIAQGPAPEARPTPAAAPQRPESQPAPAPSVAAPAQAAPDALPATASNWAQFLLLGVALITMAAVVLRV